MAVYRDGNKLCPPKLKDRMPMDKGTPATLNRGRFVFGNPARAHKAVLNQTLSSEISIFVALRALTVQGQSQSVFY